MKYRFSFLTFFFCLFTIINSHQANAQADRFKAGLILGLNAAQINGDESAGFNKLGLQGGLRGVAIINDKIDVSIELLYSQRGARQDLFGAGATFNDLRLNFVEVPLIFNFKDWYFDDLDFYRFNFYAGLSFGRLISSTTNSIIWEPFLIQFNKNDFSWLAGATFNTRPNLGLGIRYTRFITRLYKPALTGPGLARPLQSFFLTFQAVYMF